MKRVRASSGHQVVAAAVAVDVTAAEVMAAAGVMVANDEAEATNGPALQRTLQSHWENLGRAGFEPAKA